ncbi:MAG TPA: twin-arginine translocase subunit TatC [Solirubrobacteraceae bacterium]|nr:twin-arginine translocase subunit TatC [Solirubrobacteraceae bacterium]
MPRRLRPIGHDDRLSVVDHLDELRSRLIVCATALIVVFGICFWQSGALLNALNKPLHTLDRQASSHLVNATADLAGVRPHLLEGSAYAHRLAVLPHSGLSAEARALIAGLGRELNASAHSLPKHYNGDNPVTLGVGEPFTETLTVCFYFAVLICSPVLLYELLAFVLPALTAEEKRVAMPIIITAPLLFFAGIVFTYIVVLPPAMRFLQGYNSSHYQAFVQARPLYAFEVMTMAAIGLAFEMPIVLLGLRALGVINGSTLTRHWRYAIVILAIIAAAMPGSDPVTTGLETAPLLVLFLASIVLLKVADRRAARREALEQVENPTVGNLT